VLTAGIPFGAFGRPLAAQTPLDISQRVAVGRQNFAQQRNVSDGQAECVDLAESLLVRERGHMTAELVERRVDAAKHQTIYYNILYCDVYDRIGRSTINDDGHSTCTYNFIGMGTRQA